MTFIPLFWFQTDLNTIDQKPLDLRMNISEEDQLLIRAFEGNIRYLKVFPFIFIIHF